MRTKKIPNDNYDERLLTYITEYVRKENVPPTIDMMLENVEGKASKSTVFNHLQRMVDAGLLVQKNVKGYYYPTSINLKEISIPKFLIEQACVELATSPKNQKLVEQLYKYIQQSNKKG